jgi:tetratricopeptide (TPR) repeat protein
VNRALAIKPDDALAIYFQGWLKRLGENYQALVAFERAVAIDPNLAVAHNYVGQIKVFLGRANEAVEHTLKAIPAESARSAAGRMVLPGGADLHSPTALQRGGRMGAARRAGQSEFALSISRAGDCARLVGAGR